MHAHASLFELEWAELLGLAVVDDDAPAEGASLFGAEQRVELRPPRAASEPSGDEQPSSRSSPAPASRATE